MDVRYQVFVSSTYRDLLAERQQVMQALLESDCIPAGMELFPASDDDQWTLITKVIADSDYYLVVIGGRYGSTDADGISYTEKEYDYAVSINKPVMAFLHGEPDTIQAGRAELDAAARERLDAFRTKAEQKMCRYWRSPEDLGGLVSRSYVKLIKSHPAVGWVRASEAATPELLSELNGLRQRVDELEQELAQSAAKPPQGAELLGQGDEMFSVQLRVSKKDPDGWYVPMSLTTKLSWDQIFKEVGPIMLGGEAPESELARSLLWFANSQINRRALDLAPTDFPTLLNFQEVKVQLTALGYIQRGTLKRGVLDDNRYWKLTPYGELYLMKLSAIPRSID